MTPLQSLVASGTKLWLDSVDPDEIARNRALGATGATSNPIIIADLIKTGRFDADIQRFLKSGHDDEAIAWAMTDKLVKRCAGRVRAGLERDGRQRRLGQLRARPAARRPGPQHARGRADEEVHRSSATEWSAGQKNRMIKVPATEGGLAALEELVAAGVNVNVTLIFSERQYIIARDACWRGIQRRKDRDRRRPSTASSSAASTCTPRRPCRTSRRRRRGRSASSTRSASGG